MRAVLKRDKSSKRTANLGVVLLSVLIFIYAFIIMPFSNISEAILLTNLTFTALAFLYLYIYVAYFGKLRKTALLYTALLTIATFSSSLITLYFIGPNSIAIIPTFFSYYLPPLAIFFPAFLFISFGFYVLKYKPFKGRSRFVLLCFFIAAALLVWLIFFFSAHKISVVPDDEEFLAIQAVGTMLSGKNPYLMNVSTLELFDFLNVKNSLILPTITTRNGIIGFMDYPAMYFLPLLPIYVLAQYSTYNTSSLTFIFAIGAFGFIFLFFVWYAIDKEFLKRPNYIIYMIAIFVISFTSSTTNYLMLATLILAYYKIDSKYLFAFLGLAASMQEMLWIPVLLFLIYVFNNKGIKSGFMTTLATIAVFLIINGYFIALSPSAYFNDIFTTLSNQLFPGPYAAFAQPLFVLYPIPLSAYSVLFYTAIAESIILLIYTNRKQLIGLFGLFPLLFLYHSVVPYYFFFISFLVITLFIGYGSKTKKSLLLKKIPKRKAKYLFLALTALIVVFAISYVLVEHTTYLKEMNIEVQGGRLIQTSKNVTYYATLKYNFSTSTNLYIYTYAFYRGSSWAPVIYGLMGSSILQNSTEHTVYNYTNYSSIINSNRLTVYGKGNRTFSLIIQNPNVTYLECAIYTTSSFYICPIVGINH